MLDYNGEDLSQEYFIIARPHLHLFCILQDGNVLAATDTYAKIEAIYNALVFSAKIEALADRVTERYQ